jgi:hypothetical protein
MVNSINAQPVGPTTRLTSFNVVSNVHDVDVFISLISNILIATHDSNAGQYGWKIWEPSIATRPGDVRNSYDIAAERVGDNTDSVDTSPKT